MSDNKFPMSDNTSIDFDSELFFDDSGSLQFKEEPKEEEQPTTTVEDLEVDEPKTTDDNPYDSRIAAMEENLQKLTGILGAFMSGQQGSNNLKVQEPEPEEMDYSDPDQIKSYVQREVQRRVNEALAPHTQSMEHAKLQSEYNVALSKYGQKFQEALPEVVELMKVDSRLDFETAYNAISALNNVRSLKKAPADGNGNLQQSKAPSREEVEKKANNLRLPSQQGISPEGTGNKRIETVDEALDRAFAEVIGRGA